MVSARRVSSGDGEPDPIASGAIPRDFGWATAVFLRRRGFPSDLFADLVAFGTVRLAEGAARRERNLARRQAEGGESWRRISLRAPPAWLLQCRFPPLRPPL